MLKAAVSGMAGSKLDVGYAFKSAEFTESGIKLLRGDNIEPGSLRWIDTKYWSPEKLDSYKNLLIDEGDIILAMDRPLISSGLKIARAKKLIYHVFWCNEWLGLNQTLRH